MTIRTVNVQPDEAGATVTSSPYLVPPTPSAVISMSAGGSIFRIG
jgi:hypothetical protein